MGTDAAPKNCSTCRYMRPEPPTCVIAPTLPDDRALRLAARAVVAHHLYGDDFPTADPTPCPEWSEVPDVR